MVELVEDTADVGGRVPAHVALTSLVGGIEAYAAAARHGFQELLAVGTSAAGGGFVDVERVDGALVGLVEVAQGIAGI